MSTGPNIKIENGLSDQLSDWHTALQNYLSVFLVQESLLFLPQNFKEDDDSDWVLADGRSRGLSSLCDAATSAKDAQAAPGGGRGLESNK